MNAIVNPALSGEWLGLLQLFRHSKEAGAGDLISGLRKIKLDDELIAALIAAVEGDNRPINAWLFSRSGDSPNLFAWIAPVLVEKKTVYAWMIGKQSPYSKELIELFF